METARWKLHNDETRTFRLPQPGTILQSDFRARDKSCLTAADLPDSHVSRYESLAL